jgi:hypothetical protein
MAYFSSSPPLAHPSLWNNHTRFNSYNSNNDNDSQGMPSSPFGTTAASGQASLGVAPPSKGQLSPTLGQAFQDAMQVASCRSLLRNQCLMCYMQEHLIKLAAGPTRTTMSFISHQTSQIKSASHGYLPGPVTTSAREDFIHPTRKTQQFAKSRFQHHRQQQDIRFYFL